MKRIIHRGLHRSAATSGERSGLLLVVAAFDAFAGASTGAGLAAIACSFRIPLSLLGICACTDRLRPVKGAPWAESVVLRCSAQLKACAPLHWVKTDDMTLARAHCANQIGNWPAQLLCVQD